MRVVDPRQVFERLAEKYNARSDVFIELRDMCGDIRDPERLTDVLLNTLEDQNAALRPS